MRLTNSKHLLRITLTGALVFSLAPAATAQGVFKWVDANGKVHYGSQPPASEAGAAPVKIQNNSTFGGNNNDSYTGSAKRQQYNADGTKKIDKDTAEFRDAMIDSLKNSNKGAAPLSCSAAMRNVESELTTWLEGGERNLKGGYITQAQFDDATAKVNRLKAALSESDCHSSTDAKRAFYQCMSSSKNSVLGCGDKHKF